ncbi:MAG: hypothetical protein AAF266_02220 [Planctomycetota bacterium]
MTLLELLCASTIATLLMVAVMGVVGGLAQTEKALASRDPGAEWQRRLAHQLTEDVRAADRIQPNANGFVLEGLLNTSQPSGVSDWKAARISYQIEETPLGKALLRTMIADSASSNMKVQVIALNVATLTTLSPVAVSIGQPLVTADQDATYVNDVLDVRSKPPAIRLILNDGSDRPIFDQVIVTR